MASEDTSIKMENVPAQITTIKLSKTNYLTWSAAIEIALASRGRGGYIDGRKKPLLITDKLYEQWYIEDSQCRNWIINAASPEIQPLILRKKTAREQWLTLESMYGQKKQDIRMYQLSREAYNMKQGELTVAEYYAALKAKWEEIDYYCDDTWTSPTDQKKYWDEIWKQRIFIFLGGLNNEFEVTRSQLLTRGVGSDIEVVYHAIESEEQRRVVMKDDPISFFERSALLSKGSKSGYWKDKKCGHCKKIGHGIDYCWDLHPEKKINRGKKPVAMSAEGKKHTDDQIKDLHAYAKKLSISNKGVSDADVINSTMAVRKYEDLVSDEWIIDSGASDHMTGLEDGEADWDWFGC